MTGGQQLGERQEGHSVAQMAHSLRAEGVAKLVVVTDEPEKYQGRIHPANSARAKHPELLNDLPPGIEVFHRDELDRIQREFRATPGCTVIIYDQTCATEKRRRRKRGTLATPAKAVLINELVCEGCGDCSLQSNCLSVEPVDTEFGRKRRINQSTCNKDFSCLNGFCPSLVTVEGGQLKKPQREAQKAIQPLSPIPDPVLPVAEQAWGIIVAGVGGTGVITIGSLLGMAAHLEGKGVVTQDAAGMAQKGGATWSHIQIANRPEAIYTTKVDTAKVDLILGCDPMVAASKVTLAATQPGRTYVALNVHGTPAATFIHNPNWQFPADSCEAAIVHAVGREHLGAFDAEQAATQLLGDSIYTNPLLLGYAWQQGRVPLTHAALMRAMELNGVQVANNQAAFEWGRRCAHDLASVQAHYRAAQIIQFVKQPGLAETVQRRVEFLTNYQNAAYADQYRAFIDKVQAAENALNMGTRLTQAVARNLFKLMAYKDEYEVARLHTDPAFTQRIGSMFEGDWRIRYHMAPPIFAKHDSHGHPRKQSYGPWMHHAMRLLARGKSLRGTAFDLFGKSAERQAERALITEYRACIESLLAELSADKLHLAVEIANIPDAIRGFGHVKQKNLTAARAQWQTLMQRWQATAVPTAADTSPISNQAEAATTV